MASACLVVRLSKLPVASFCRAFKASKKKKKAEKEKPKPEKKPAQQEEQEESEAQEEPKQEEQVESEAELDTKDPSSPLNLEHWKRLYSNEDTRTVALPYFWETLAKDPDGWSLWFSEYKYNNELEKLYMTNNLVGGFIQRCDKVRKYAFASILIFGEEKPNLSIAGVWLIRGTELHPELKDVPDFESYEWRKLDPSVPADKKIVEDYFAWNGDFGERVFNNQGKLLK